MSRTAHRTELVAVGHCGSLCITLSRRRQDTGRDRPPWADSLGVPSCPILSGPSEAVCCVEDDSLPARGQLHFTCEASALSLCHLHNMLIYILLLQKGI